MPKRRGVKARSPKVLLWDLETGGVNALRSDLGLVLNFGYKWLNDKDTHVLTIDQYPGWFSTDRGLNDKGLLTDSLKIMEEADLLVAHYGDKFDRRFFQGRCAINGLKPPPPTKQRDTWRIARRAFNFSSNRLGNLSNIFNLRQKKYQKRAHEWPGWWIRAMSGDVQAIHDMAVYCAQDVRTLEALYKRIQQYDYPHPNLYPDRGVCATCGGAVHYRGLAITGKYKYKRFQCQTCGRWGRDAKRDDS